MVALYTYCAANNEQSLFFLLNPLGNLAGTLYQSISICAWLSDAIKFENRSYPCKGGSRSRDTMMNFDMCVLGVNACVEIVVHRH